MVLMRTRLNHATSSSSSCDLVRTPLSESSGEFRRDSAISTLRPNSTIFLDLAAGADVVERLYTIIQTRLQGSWG